MSFAGATTDAALNTTGLASGEVTSLCGGCPGIPF